MRWYIDTEFNEDGRSLELISIALVRELVPGYGTPGVTRHYHAVSNEFDPDACNPWVKEHVIAHLPDKATWKPRRVIAQEIKDLVLGSRSRMDREVEFWGWYADYDWVVLCRLFGSMIDLPEGMPQYCNDIRQLVHMYAIPKDQLPVQDPATAHDALSDALHHRDLHDRIRTLVNGLPPRRL